MPKLYNNSMAEGLDDSKEDNDLPLSHSNFKGSRNSMPNTKNENFKSHDNGRYASNSNGYAEDKVCRDFLRNVCNRGKRCKFFHPNDSSTNQNNKKNITFCHDFRNGYCPRNNCRFIHCSAEEEGRYLNSGELLPNILEQCVLKGQILDHQPKGSAPICKDFIMGECVRKRGGKCRFRHLTKYEYKREVFGSDPHYGSTYDRSFDDSYAMDGRSHSPLTHDSKRPRFDSLDRDFLRSFDEHSRDHEFSRDMAFREFRDREREWDRERDRRGIEEVLYLRKQLETLKKESVVLRKENSDLRATNDFLLEKITTMGMAKGGGTVTTMTVPAVSIAPTIPVATSVQHLTAAQVSHPLSIASEGCSVGSVVAMPAGPPQAQPPPQSLAPPPTGVLAPVGSVQVTLSQAMAPNAVSLSTVNLNSMGPQTSLAPSIAPPPGSAPNIAQGMSMSGASGHLVTYPIMTQPALRQQMQ